MKPKSKTFVDSNILLYTLDSRDTPKQHAARKALEEAGPNLVVSIQVLQEVYINALLKLKLGNLRAREMVDSLAKMTVVCPDAAMVLRAIATSEHHQLSFWDSMIVEAAVAGKCATLLTEDLNHGQVINGVKIVNPLR